MRSAITKYRAVHHSGTRSLLQITTGVVHCTEGDTALGAASWFANPRSAGSAQVCTDDRETYRTLPDWLIPWGAPPLNTAGVHIEIAGFTRWTTTQWMRHRARVDDAAYRMAVRCKQFGIPVVWLTVADLKAGKRHGITSHNNISLAFRMSTHTDPGNGFPRAYFMWKVKQYLKRL